jgi:hypothetical protein
MPRRILRIYIDGHPVPDTGTAAAEASRLLGKKVETWQIRACIEMGKGYIGNVSVRQRVTPEVRRVEPVRGRRGRPPKYRPPAGREPLLRMDPLSLGIPPGRA